MVAVVAIMTVIGATLGLSLFVWKSPNRVNLATFWAFVAAVATVSLVLIGGMVRWAANVWTRRGSRGDDSAALNKVVDRLADAVQDQWARAAIDRLLLPEPIPVRWQRSSKPFANPISAAADSRQFPPLPEISPVGEEQLREGGLGDLHAVYGGLGSGRLVIVGSPGSGKSGAAVLLVLAALKHRKLLSEQDRMSVPVPVIFTMHGWDPNRERVQDWLARRLHQAYPLFAGRRGTANAAELVRTGRISAILDGLDEIPASLRPVALRALSQQALFRVVVLVRSVEMTAAAQLHVLEGAVALELQHVDSSVAAGYLTRIQRDPPPTAWRELTDRLHCAPNSPLAKALNNPLTLTLVRDTYRSDNDAAELLDFCDADGHGRSREEIEDHLLDRVLPTAYAQHPGDEATLYGLREAERALRYIAVRMNQENTRDLGWWRVPAWTSPVPCLITTAAISGLVVGLVAGLVVGLVVGPGDGLLFGLAGLVGGGLTFGLVLGPRNRSPLWIATVQWEIIFRRTYILLLFGSIVWKVLGLAAGIAAGLAGAIAFVLVDVLSRSGAEDASPLSPLASWQRDRNVGLVVGLVGGLAFGLVGGLAFGFAGVLTAPLTVGLVIGLAGGIMSGLLVGLAGGLMYSQSWATSLAFAQLAWRSHTPIRLMRFLEDAHKRNVLRTVGPVYQFRHARLQDRLADQAHRSAGPEVQYHSEESSL